MSRAFDDLLSCFDPAMTIVTTVSGPGRVERVERAERAGCLVGFQTQSSLDPPRFVVCLSKANHTFRVGLRAKHFAVHFLTDVDLDMAELFGTRSGDRVDKFSDCAWSEAIGGTPLLDRLPNRFVGRRVALLDAGGDHVSLILEPLRSDHAGPFQPLRLSRVRHLRPGHESDERPLPPTERSLGGEAGPGGRGSNLSPSSSRRSRACCRRDPGRRRP